MIPIENKTDWNAIRAEYIGGGISQRKLAKKYGVSETTLMKKANTEGWHEMRSNADSKSAALAQQRTASAAADNATIAADLKRRLLMRMSRLEQKFPIDATEIKINDKGKQVTYRLRDLTASFKDVTEDMQMGGNATNDLLQSLIELERRAR